MENTRWLELFHPFTAVKNMYLSKELALRVMPTLQIIAKGNTTEVVPVLQNIFFEEPKSFWPVQEAIRQFVAARQLTGCPVAVHRWEIVREMWYEVDDW